MPKSEIRSPKFEVRNPNFSRDNERSTPLLYYLVVAGLLLGAIAFSQAALGVLLFLTSQLMNSAYVILSAAVLAIYLSHRLNEAYGLLGALLFLTAPPALLPTSVGPLLFYTTATLLCLFLWCETRKAPWLITAGLTIGFAACSVAWMAAILLLASGPAFLALLSHWAHRAEVTGKSALLLALCGIIPYAVWNILVWATNAGNVAVRPVFGYDTVAAFDLQPLLAEDATLVTVLEVIVKSILGVSFGEVRLPHTLIVGPGAVCFLPWAFKGKWGHEKRIFLAVALTFVLLASYTGGLKSIGLLPITPLLAVLATYGIHNLYMNVRRPALLFATVAVLFTWNAVTLWRYVG